MVDQNEAGLGEIVGRAHDRVEQVAGADGLVHFAGEGQVPILVFLDGFHEGVRDGDRHVEHLQGGIAALGGDELLDIGMRDREDRHLRAAALAGAHDRAAGGIEDLHEADRAGGLRLDAANVITARADGREIKADAAALFLGQGRFRDGAEDALHRVLNRAHHVAVEHGHFLATGAGIGQDAAGRQEFVALQDGIKLVFPEAVVALRHGDGVGDAPPRVLNCLINGRTVFVLVTVFHVPYLVGNRVVHFRYLCYSQKQ